METTYVDKSRVTVRPIYKPLAKDMIEKNQLYKYIQVKKGIQVVCLEQDIHGH